MIIINKYFLIPVAFILLIAASEAKAIVFIPPVIYIASLSIGAFIINVFAFFAVWFAARGLIDRMYFGKPMHEIVRALFGLIGKFALVIIVAVASIKIVDPLNKKGIISAAIFATAFGSILFVLANFREYRLEFKRNQFAIMRSILVFAAAIFLITYSSSVWALKIKAINMRKSGFIEYRRTNLTLPDTETTEQNSTLDEARNIESGAMPAEY